MLMNFECFAVCRQLWPTICHQLVSFSSLDLLEFSLVACFAGLVCFATGNPGVWSGWLDDDEEGN